MIRGKPVINKDLTNSRLKELLKHLKIEYFYEDRWDCFYISHPVYIEFPVNCTIKKFIELLFIVYYKNGFNDAIDTIRYVDDELFYKQRDKKIKQIKIK